MEIKKLLSEVDQLMAQVDAIENTKRYYVSNSSWFNSHPYDVRRIAEAVKSAGATKVTTAHAFGWSNQPQVVCFSTTVDNVENVKSELQTTLGTPWIIILEKDW